MVYHNFDLDDRSTSYRGLMLSCKQINQEALSELLATKAEYYREYVKVLAKIEVPVRKVTISRASKLDQVKVTIHGTPHNIPQYPLPLINRAANVDYHLPDIDHEGLAGAAYNILSWVNYELTLS